MPQLSYDKFYNAQMQFIHRYISGKFDYADMQRIARINQMKNSQHMHFMDDFLLIQPGNELKTTRIGYRPLEHIDADLIPYPNENEIMAPQKAEIYGRDRRCSRYRLIEGPVDFYLDRNLENAITMHVITTCAPNLMGTSENDLQFYCKNYIPDQRSYELNNDRYQQECNKIAEFIISTAKASGTEKLIMPAFGVGVYIQKLSHESKKMAREIMFRSFAAAANRHQLPVDWIVWDNPRNPSEGPEMQAVLNNFSNDFMKTTLHSDMLTYAKAEKERGLNISILNPGSDRTVGGAYTARNPKTLEEQIAQQSDLVLLHTVFNQPMVDEFNMKLAARRAALQQQHNPAAQQPVPAPAMPNSIQPDIIVAPTAEEPQANYAKLVPSRVTFFSVPDTPVPQKTITPKQVEMIQKQIDILNSEINHWWPYPNKDRKQHKHDALVSLLQLAENKPLLEAIDDIEGRYASVNAGKYSKRTAHLLERLKHQETLAGHVNPHHQY